MDPWFHGVPMATQKMDDGPMEVAKGLNLNDQALVKASFKPSLRIPILQRLIYDLKLGNLGCIKQHP